MYDKNDPEDAHTMRILILLLMFPVIGLIVFVGNKVSNSDTKISFVSEAQAARELTPEQMREYRKRIAEKRKSAEFQRRKAEAEERVRLNKIRESRQYKTLEAQRYHQARQRELEKMAQERNKVTLYKGGKHSESIAFYHAKLESKKSEVKTLLAEIKGLQVALNQLVQEKIQAEPDIDLSRLLSLSDPNYIDDPNTLTIDVIEGVTPPIVEQKQDPTFNSAPVETKKETLFIDLKARD